MVCESARSCIGYGSRGGEFGVRDVIGEIDGFVIVFNFLGSAVLFVFDIKIGPSKYESDRLCVSASILLGCDVFYDVIISR